MVAIALIILARGQDLQSILPVLGMYAVAAMCLMPSASRIANGLAQLRFHYAATETLYDELCATDRNRLELTRPASDRDKSSSLPSESSLALEHLSCRYPSMPEPAIEDISERTLGGWRLSGQQVPVKAPSSI